MEQYIIVNVSNEKDYWSNAEGWTDAVDLADLFTENEKDNFDLPIGGKWQAVRVFKNETNVNTANAAKNTLYILSLDGWYYTARVDDGELFELGYYDVDDWADLHGITSTIYLCED